MHCIVLPRKMKTGSYNQKVLPQSDSFRQCKPDLNYVLLFFSSKPLRNKKGLSLIFLLIRHYSQNLDSKPFCSLLDVHAYMYRRWRHSRKSIITSKNASPSEQNHRSTVQFRAFCSDFFSRSLWLHLGTPHA